MKRLAAASVAAAAAAVLAYAALWAPDGAQAPDRGLGLVVNAPGAADAEQARRIYELAASAGAGRTNAYMFWNLVEPEPGVFDWSSTDPAVSLSRDNGLAVTLFFSVVNGASLGPFPGWMGEDLESVDPERLSAVLDAALSRYGAVDSLIIAGQAEEQFRYSEQGARAYLELFEQVYSELKARHPDVTIGNAFSLHGVINKNLGHLVEQLGSGDFVAFTYFPVDSLNDISRTPSEARADLEAALELSGGRPAAFFEAGWSTSGFVGGSEADQAEFAGELLDFYEQNRDSVEFVTWYRQHDRPEGSCSFSPELTEGAVSVGGSAELGSSEHVAQRLGHYVCASGLLREDGSPKPAWSVFARP